MNDALYAQAVGQRGVLPPSAPRNNPTKRLAARRVPQGWQPSVIDLRNPPPLPPNVQANPLQNLQRLTQQQPPRNPASMGPPPRRPPQHSPARQGSSFQGSPSTAMIPDRGSRSHSFHSSLDNHALGQLPPGIKVTISYEVPRSSDTALGQLPAQRQRTVGPQPSRDATDHPGYADMPPPPPSPPSLFHDHHLRRR